MKDKNYIRGQFEETKKVIDMFLREHRDVEILRASEIIVGSLKNGGRMLICGNGGSATDASHITGELVGRYKLNRPALDVITLGSDLAVTTAVSNDFGYENLYAKEVEGRGREGDILLGISTSGNSKSIVNALEMGKHMGLKNITLTGNDGGKMKALSDININVPYSDTPRIQEVHTIIYHTLCDLIEQGMFGGFK